MALTDIQSTEKWIKFEKELFDRYQINCTVYYSSGISVTSNVNSLKPI